MDLRNVDIRWGQFLCVAIHSLIVSLVTCIDDVAISEVVECMLMFFMILTSRLQQSTLG